MILRSWISFRLEGRRLTHAPTSLLEGIAQMMITGSFHRWRELEPLAAGEMARRMLALLPPDLVWTRVEGGGGAGARIDRDSIAPDLTRLDIRHAGSADGLPCIGTLRFRSAHPRGRPALTVELTMVPSPTEPARDADMTQLVRRSYMDARSMEAMTRRARGILEGLQGRVIEVMKRALPVESVVIDTEEGAVTRWAAGEISEFPAATAAWLVAVAELAVAHPAAFGDALAPSGDFAGWLDDGAVADGGGSLDSWPSPDAGGGHLGGA